MRSGYFLLSLAALYLLLVTSRCANPISPAGGPKDTIPPTLLAAEPETGTILYNEQTLQLTFDEFISADKLRSNLIITPQTDTRYQSVVKKNRITITFDEPFEDSITYTFNFFNSITDITEKTPAENLIIAFSTGPYIDSLTIKGKVMDLLTQQPRESYIAALYPWSDTLDYASDKPMYFATTKEDGTFQLTYIKAGIYKLLAFEDSNNNLLLESQTEPHGFLSDSINLQQPVDSLTIQTLLLDIREPQLISARPFGAYFQARYNKPIISYTYTSSDPEIPLYSRLSPDRENIQFYPNVQVLDSLQLILQATDTTSTTITDTVYLKYTPSQLRQEDLVVKLSPPDKASFRDSLLISLDFSQPITDFDPKRLRLHNDTLLSISPDTLITDWSFDKTSLQISIPWSWPTYQDTLTNTIRAINDTIPINPSFLSQVQFTLDSGAFKTVTNDSTVMLTRSYTQFDPAQTGIITYEITPPTSDVIVQLITKDYATVREIKYEAQAIFKDISPGTYGLRILLDTNQDGQWSYGNINSNKEPEPVIVYDEFTELRANWEVNIPPITIDNL